MTKTRIAVAGAGAIGQAHIGVALRSPGCELCAIVDPSPAAVSAAGVAGVPLYGSIDELLTQNRPDGLILATPNALHVPQALQCIAAGLPILLEKPIATTVAEGQQLVDALVSARDGLANLRITQAIAEAAASGQTIEIPAA